MPTWLAIVSHQSTPLKPRCVSGFSPSLFCQVVLRMILMIEGKPKLSGCGSITANDAISLRSSRADQRRRLDRSKR